MLNFKFTNDLSSFDQTGPVPVAAVYGGIAHTPIIEYSENFIDFSVHSALLNENKVGDFSFKSIGNFPLNHNLLRHTEDWTITGAYAADEVNTWSSSNTGFLVAEASTDEALLYNYPYYKLNVYNVDQDLNVLYRQIFESAAGATDESYTFSFYISYGALNSHPATGGLDALSSVYIRGVDGPDDASETGIHLTWDTADGILEKVEDIPGTEGHISHGYEPIFAGDRLWYKVWVTGQNGANLSELEVAIYPGGYTDFAQAGWETQVPNGHVFVSHPQITLGKSLKEYQPFVENYQEDDNAIITGYLAGPPNRNMSAPIKTEAVVYNLLDNTKFTDYDIQDNKIIFSIKDYKEKVLVYRDKDDDNVIMIIAKPRFLTIINYPVAEDPFISFPNMPFSLCSLQQNLLQRFETKLPEIEPTQSWKPEIYIGPSMIDGNLSQFSGLQPRPRIIWNEKPKRVTSTLLQVSKKGIRNWVTSNFGAIDSSFFEAASSSISVFFNYDVTILGIDSDKGLILLEEQAPSDLLVSYCVDESWKMVPEEMNPLFADVPKSILLKSDSMGNLMYSKEGTSLLYSNSEPQYSLENVASQYKPLVNISFLYDTPQLIDIRREGGKLINTQSSEYDISSHVTYGNMGVNPSQLNVVVVKIPDSVLEKFIYNFEELHPLYVSESPLTFPLDWSTNREVYLELFRYRTENGMPNVFLLELLVAVRKYSPTGITLSITDKDTNEIYTE